MKLGVVSAIFAQQTFEEMIAIVAENGLRVRGSCLLAARKSRKTLCWRFSY